MKKNKNNIEEQIIFGDLITGIALCFLGALYKENTLEAKGKEKLIVDFTNFDCFTFVETVLVLARCFINGKIFLRAFERRLKFIRYRQGVIAGYSSRLHYFTDWLRDNEKKKIVKDISKTIGGKTKCKKISFMTGHRHLYPALKSEKEFQKMLNFERNLSRKVFLIVDKTKTSLQIKKIQNGDIVAFATNVEGLDVSHVGFALWQGRNLYLLHASSKEGAVVVSQKTLPAYLKSKKKFTGIIVARPV